MGNVFCVMYVVCLVDLHGSKRVGLMFVSVTKNFGVNNLKPKNKKLKSIK